MKYIREIENTVEYLSKNMSVNGFRSLQHSRIKPRKERVYLDGIPSLVKEWSINNSNIPGSWECRIAEYEDEDPPVPNRYAELLGGPSNTKLIMQLGIACNISQDGTGFNDENSLENSYNIFKETFDKVLPSYLNFEETCFGICYESWDDIKHYSIRKALSGGQEYLILWFGLHFYMDEDFYLNDN